MFGLPSDETFFGNTTVTEISLIQAAQSVPSADCADGDAREVSPSRLFFYWALPCVFWLCLLYVAEIQIRKWPLEVSGYPVFRDFMNLWAGAVSVLQGHLTSVFDSGLHSAEIGRLLAIPPPSLMWSYPPTALLLVLPFGLLPFPVASAIWIGLGLIAYFLAAGAMSVGRPDRTIWFAAILLCPGVATCAAYGQTAFLTSAALIVGLLEARRRPMVSGLCFALLAAKPQVAIVVPFALAALGAGRAVLATAFFVCLYLGATVLVFGVEAWRLFMDITMPQQFAVLNSEAFKPVMMMSPYFLFRGLGASLWWSYTLQVVVSVVALVTVCVPLMRERDENIQILVIACAALVTSAYMQTYELPLLVAAVARVCASRTGFTRFSGKRIHVLLASVTIGMLIAMGIVMTMKVNVIAVILIGLLGWLARDILSESRAKDRGRFRKAAASLG